MKGFYVIAPAVVILLTLSPFCLLDEEKSTESIDRVIWYGTYPAKIKSMDPATCGDTTSASMQGGIYEGLYTYHYLKRPVEVIPLLAAGPPVISSKGLVFTIRIKEGVKFHRNPCFGKDPADKDKWATRTVTAEDFVLAFKRVADSHLVTSLSYAFLRGRIAGIDDYRERTKAYQKGDFSRYKREKIEGIRATDELTLEITLTKVFPQLQYILALNSYAPVPHEVISYHLATRPGRGGRRIDREMAERSSEIHAREAVVGTGPYILAEWKEGQRIILRRNEDFREDYYPTEGTDEDVAAGLLEDEYKGKRIPFIDEMRFTFIPEASTSWSKFEKMQTDSAGVPRDMYDKVITSEADLAKRYSAMGVKLAKYRYPAVYWLVFNMDDPIMGASKSLRQALCLSYDVESHIKVLFNGRGVRAVNVIPSSFKGHKEVGPSPYARMDVAAAKRLIPKARQELVAAGAIKSGQDIPELTLDLGGREEAQRRMGEFVQSEFRKIGVKVKVVLNDWPTLQKKVHNKQCQIYTMGWHADYPDAENFLQLYYTPNIRVGTNNSNYSSPAFDKVFKQASVISDVEKRVPLYVEMMKIVNKDCPVLLLSEPIYFALRHAWVRNAKPHPIGYGMSKYRAIDTGLRARLRRAGGQ